MWRLTAFGTKAAAQAGAATDVIVVELGDGATCHSVAGFGLDLETSLTGPAEAGAAGFVDGDSARIVATREARRRLETRRIVVAPAVQALSSRTVAFSRATILDRDCRGERLVADAALGLASRATIVRTSAADRAIPLLFAALCPRAIGDCIGPAVVRLANLVPGGFRAAARVHCALFVSAFDCWANTLNASQVFTDSGTPAERGFGARCLARLCGSPGTTAATALHRSRAKGRAVCRDEHVARATQLPWYAGGFAAIGERIALANRAGQRRAPSAVGCADLIRRIRTARLACNAIIPTGGQTFTDIAAERILGAQRKLPMSGFAGTVGVVARDAFSPAVCALTPGGILAAAEAVRFRDALAFLTLSGESQAPIVIAVPN